MSDQGKRNKRRYGGSQAGGKRRRTGRELEPGMEGILITCNMKERQCTAEAYNLLSEYADQLYGPEQVEDDTHDSIEDDVVPLMEKELKPFRWNTERRPRRFAALDSGAHNVLFIRTHDIDPGRLVHAIMEDLYSTRTLKSRVIFRMLPVYGTCRAFPEDIMKFLYSFLQPWFLFPNHASYQICYKSRNNSHSKRDDIMKNIAGLVSRLNPKNKVNLTNPQLSIIVEVIKTVCCVSVIRDYKHFRKYNLQEVTKGPATEDSLQQEETKGPATAESSQQEVSKGPATADSSQQEVSKGPTTAESSQQEVSKGPTTAESSQQEVSKGPTTAESSLQEVSKGPTTAESSQQEVSKGPATAESSQQEVSKGPATAESSQQEVSKGQATEESSQQEVDKGPPTEESSQQEVAKGPPTEESSQQEVAKGPPTEESSQQEVAKGQATEESSQQEVAKGPPTEESSQQEVAKGPPTEESSQQEVSKGPPTEESSQQEVGESEANKEQEVPKDLASQEPGQQEVAESQANQTKEQEVGGDSGVKEAEQE